MSRLLIKEIHSLENATYLFHETYNYFPGDMPDTSKHWALDDFNKKCIYWDTLTGRRINFEKGVSGNGDHKVYWDNSSPDVTKETFVSLSTPKSQVQQTDRFYEATGGPCHLLLAEVINDSRLEPVVLNKAEDAEYHRISGIKINSNDFLIGYHNKMNEYEIVFTGMHRWQIAKGDTTRSQNTLNNTNTTVKQMYIVDKKIDDGLPGNGKLRCGTKVPNVKICSLRYYDNSCRTPVSSCCSDYDIVRDQYVCKENSKYNTMQFSHNAGYLYYISPILQDRPIPDVPTPQESTLLPN